MPAPDPANLERLRKALHLQRDGKIARARTIYEKILKSEPDNFEAANLLGMCFLEQDFPKRALPLFERAARLAPGEERYAVNLVDCLARLGEGADPLAAVETALAGMATPSPVLLHRRAMLLRQAGRFAEALAAYDAAVRADPQNAEVLVEFGQTLILAGKHEEALRVLEFVLAGDASHRLALLSLADALNQLDRAGDARDLLLARSAAFDTSRDAGYHLSLANAHWGCGEHTLALAGAERAIGLGLAGPDSHLVRGKALYHLGRFGEAIEALDEALALDPGRHEAAMTLGFACLANGDLARGWALAERRMEAVTKGLITRSFTRPRWQGEPLDGRTLMIWDDQGIGDVLRAASMFDELVGRAEKLIVECHPKLIPLLARNFPQVAVRARQHEALGTLFGTENFDYQCSFGTLPMYLRPTIFDFPKRRSFLTADPARVAELRQRPPLGSDRPKVGLSWTSGNRSGLRAASYLTLTDLLPLLENDAVDFVLLDYTDRSAEIAELQQRASFTLHRWDDLDLFDDLETVAALASCMDLVISANTSVADMSGALGVPTWRFGPVTGTILLGEENPPWSPATRYLRIPPERPAGEIVPRLDSDLRDWLAARR
jgi:tetratricopeptide (TPR) repeat protein